METNKGSKWERFKAWAFRHDFVHCFPMLMFLVAYLIWFHILEIVPRRHYIEIGLKIDRMIPFCEYFIVLYLSWFAFVAIGGIYLYIRDREEYDRLMTVLVIGMTFFLVVSTLFPNRLNLRLAKMPRDNIFCRLVEFVWSTDTPTNVWPSIHVFNSISVAMGLTRSNCRKKKPVWLSAGIIIWAGMIILSTVFVKQHSVVDVIGGALLALCCFIYTYGFGRVFWLKSYKEFVVLRKSGWFVEENADGTVKKTSPKKREKALY